LTGTNTGTLMGIPAKNQKINLKGMSFVRIKDGKIIYKADYYDAATLNKQLGWQ
jgi:predicted ester cyclase